MNSDDYKKLSNDIKESDDCRQEISSLLDKSNDEDKGVDFENSENIRNKLKDAISDSKKSRAVRKVCIWRHISYISKKFVLFDLPGFDSVFSEHKEQTKNKLSKVDCIIYAKRFSTPDLVSPEMELLKLSDNSNPYIKAKDKIVVALTRFDEVISSEEFNEIKIQNEEVWKSHGLLPQQIIPVCARNQMKLEDNDREGLELRLKQLNLADDGFENLKKAVIKCATNLINVAYERCNMLKYRMKDESRTLFNVIKENFNLDMNSKIWDENEMEKIYIKWWKNEWGKIQKEFQYFFSTNIKSKPDADSPTYLSNDAEKFKIDYDNAVDDAFKKIFDEKKKLMSKTYFSCSENEGIVSPKEGNVKIRNELWNEFLNSIHKIAEKINSNVWNSINKVIDWIKCILWNIPEVKKEMVCRGEDELMLKLLDALIQRLARPATDIFLRYPRSRIERLKIMQEYQIELVILDSFIESGKTKSRGIIKFLATGINDEFKVDVTYPQKFLDSNRLLNGNFKTFVHRIENEGNQIDNKNHRLTTAQMIGQNNQNNYNHNQLANREKWLPTTASIIYNSETEKQSEEEQLKNIIKTEKKRKGSLFRRNKSEKDHEKIFTTNNNRKIHLIPQLDETSSLNSSFSTHLDSIPIQTPPMFRKELPVATSETKMYETSQFSTLEFVPDSSNFTEVASEIDADINEFIACMKNSVFYGSGIQRFYNQELDKYRRKFIELEEKIGVWGQLVCIILKFKI